MPKQFTGTAGATASGTNTQSSALDSAAHDVPVGVQKQTITESIGWLTFWTLPDGHYKADPIRIQAVSHKVPDWMVERVKGRTADSAWKTATQLGARGRPSRLTADEVALTEGMGLARYLVRDLNDASRVLIREVILPTKEKVSVQNVAVLYLENGQMIHELTDEGEGLIAILRDELLDLIGKLRTRMEAIDGLVNSGKIRQIILRWLELQYRICVRGTGGVYFIPRPKDELIAKALVDDMLAIQEWIRSKPVEGYFSTVELFNTDTTTTDTFIDSAVEEIRAEVEEVGSKLKGWGKNDNMNAGSIAYSTGEMVTRMGALMDKIDALEDSLGDKVGVTRTMVEIVLQKAKKMEQEAAKRVQADRDARDKAKATKQAQANGDKPKRSGKTGTAKNRAAKIS